jgi:hypothetical protein
MGKCLRPAGFSVIAMYLPQNAKLAKISFQLRACSIAGYLQTHFIWPGRCRTGCCADGKLSENGLIVPKKEINASTPLIQWRMVQNAVSKKEIKNCLLKHIDIYNKIT